MGFRKSDDDLSDAHLHEASDELIKTDQELDRLVAEARQNRLLREQFRSDVEQPKLDVETLWERWSAKQGNPPKYRDLSHTQRLIIEAFREAFRAELRELDVVFSLWFTGWRHITRPPGSRLLSVADFLYSPKTVDLTFKALVADWQKEYFDALRERRLMKARWISVRYRVRFVWSMGMTQILSLFKKIMSAGR